MINKEKAKEILLNSVKSYVNNNGQITKSNLEAEIINNICLFLLNSIPKNPSTNSPDFIDQVTEIFISAAEELFNDNYSEPAKINTRFAIHQNLSWDGMENFLNEYFLKNHKKEVDRKIDTHLRQQVKKIAGLLISVLNQEGANYKANAVIQVLNDFKTTTMSQINEDIRNNDYSEIEYLEKNIKKYRKLIHLIENRFLHNNSKLENAERKALKIYEYYENKYIEELEHRNDEQRKEFIETILAPLMIVYLYLVEISESL
jgi:hypothetical protein